LFCTLQFVNCEEDSKDLWVKFVKKYEKKYDSPRAELARYEIFKQGLERIAKLNSLETAATFGVTEFTDFTPTEFKAKYLSKTPAVVDPNWPVAGLDITPEEIAALPTSWDWRTLGAVTPVKNQGDCGSCWSFSTTGNVEGQWFLSNHSLVGLSEQNLVDCDHECMMYEGEKSCDQGCNGGLQPNAYTYILKNNGIDTEASYPYEAVDDKCRFKPTNVGATISNWTMVSSDEGQMAAYLVQHGPLAIAADAAEWQYYTGGVFDLPCGKNLDHGILIVGYGSEMTILGEKQYWIVKNSWGASWGEEGYLKIVYGKGECGLNTFVSSSIIF